MLTGGELKADTLFNLWTPLKQTIIRLNDEETIQLVGDISRKYDFLREFVKYDNIEYLLPMDKMPVHSLSMLFGLGMGKGNVFVLPDRKLNYARAKKPYYDYMPAFYWNLFREARLRAIGMVWMIICNGFTESIWRCFLTVRFRWRISEI